MEKTRLFLTANDGEYVIEVSNSPYPSFTGGIYFTLNCNNSGKSIYKTLDDIISWGRNYAKNHNTTPEIDEKIRKQ